MAPADVHGFPPVLTSFVGRGVEVAEVAGLLSRQRLVTVTGPGGVGKTRLAGEVARAVAGRFADGAWLVELAAVPEPALVQAAVATALGIRQPPGTSLLEALTVVLARQQLLLVLDNCEHVLAAAADLCGALLAAADDVRILATSREPVGMAGEARYRLAPLAVPGPADLSGTGGSEAVALFADRARLADAHFTLDRESGPVVAQLVGRLDGMPLAIELAAARVEALGVAQLLARLDDRFRLLVGGDRLAAVRQRSLAATVDWSYQLLSEQERQVFRLLSVFPAPFTLEAAAAVAGAAADPVVLHLVDCSLLAPPRTGPDGRARYLMLETLREFATQRLAEAAKQPAAAQAMAVHTLGLAEEAAAGLASSGEEELAAARWLDAEDATVHQALAWALEHDGDTALRLAIALAPWWVLRGRAVAGYALLRAAAKHAATGSDPWCAAQLWLGHLAPSARQGLDHFTAVRDALTPPEPSALLVRALNERAACLANMDRIPEASQDARRALVMAQALGYPAGEARALSVLMGAAGYTGDHQGTLTWMRQAQHIDAANLPGRVARACSYQLAVAFFETGEYYSAQQTCARGLDLARQAGDLPYQAEILSLIADLDCRAGRMDEAWAHLREALEIALRIGDQVTLIGSVDVCGFMCAASWRWDETIAVWAAAAACSQERGLLDFAARDLRYVGDMRPEARRRQEAVREARQALGPARTQAAEERGAAMTLAAAAEYALLLMSEDSQEPHAHAGPEPAQSPRAGAGYPGRARQHQRADRRPAVHQRQHRRLAPGPDPGQDRLPPPR